MSLEFSSPDEPTLEDQRAYYDRWNTSYRKGGLDSVDPEIRNRGIKAFEELCALNLSDPSILEIGCGTGWLTEKLSEIGQTTAIDLSPAAIEIARESGIEAEFIAGDFMEEEFAQAPFDLGICIETLFYISDQPRFMKKFASLLKPGAHVVFSNINKFVYERSSDIGPPAPGQIRHWLDKSELRELFAPHFDILSMRSIEPRGDMGVLRVVNSYKLNALFDRLLSSATVKRSKEKLGFGGGIIIVARRKAD